MFCSRGFWLARQHSVRFMSLSFSAYLISPFISEDPLFDFRAGLESVRFRPTVVLYVINSDRHIAPLFPSSITSISAITPF